MKRESIPKKQHEQKLQEKADNLSQEHSLEMVKFESKYKSLKQE